MSGHIERYFDHLAHRFRKDATRNAHRNASRHPRSSKFMSLFKWAIWTETCDDHRGFRWSKFMSLFKWAVWKESFFIAMTTEDFDFHFDDHFDDRLPFLYACHFYIRVGPLLVIWYIWHSVLCQRYDTCVAVCCSVLQCVAVCCSVLQCVAVCCRHMTHVQMTEFHTYIWDGYC